VGIKERKSGEETDMIGEENLDGAGTMLQ